MSTTSDPEPSIYWPCPVCSEPSARVLKLGADDGRGMQCVACLHQWRRESLIADPIEGDIDSLEKLYQAFKHLKPGSMVIHTRSDLPLPPSTSRWNDFVLLIKATRSTDEADEGAKADWWLIALMSDKEIAIQEAHNMIHRLGGKVTSEQMVTPSLAESTEVN